MKVRRHQFLKSVLEDIKQPERYQMVSAGLLLNELNTLLTCTLLSSPLENEENEVVQQAQTCQTFYFLLLLGAKAKEAWKLIDSTAPSGAQRDPYVARLGEEAQASFKVLQAYFKVDGSDLITSVRNKVTFHHDVKLIDEALREMDSHEPVELWITQHAGSTRNPLGTLIAVAAIKLLTGEPDRKVALKRYRKDVLTASGALQVFLASWFYSVVEKHIVLANAIEVEVPSPDVPQIPAFADLSRRKDIWEAGE